MTGPTKKTHCQTSKPALQLKGNKVRYDEEPYSDEEILQQVNRLRQYKFGEISMVAREGQITEIFVTESLRKPKNRR